MRSLRALGAALAPLALLTLAAAGQAAPPGEAPTPAAARAIALLRDSRLPDAPPTEITVAELATVADAAFDELAEVLAARRVPALSAEESVQTLSVPQREMILDAVARLDGQRVRGRLEPWLDGATQEQHEDRLRAAVDLRCAAGDAADVPWLLAVLVPDEGPAPADGTLEAYERGLVRVLRRDPRALAAVEEIWRRREQALLPGLLRALGHAADPGALGLLLDVAMWDEELAGLAVAQVRKVGASADPSVNLAFADLLRPQLDPAQDRARCRTALTALAELGDFDSVPRMIQLLDPQSGVQGEALWSLRRLTGLGFGDAERWARWHEGEARWFEREYPGVLRDLHSIDPARSLAAAREIANHRLHRHELAEELARALERAPRVHKATLCAGLLALDSERGAPGLVRALEQEADPAVRSAAAQALAGITGQNLGTNAEAWRAELGL